jgi:hypothetical protein
MTFYFRVMRHRILQWIYRQYVSRKPRYLSSPHGVISWKNKIVFAVTTSELINQIAFSKK